MKCRSSAFFTPARGPQRLGNEKARVALGQIHPAARFYPWAAVFLISPPREVVEKVVLPYLPADFANRIFLVAAFAGLAAFLEACEGQ